MFPPRLFCASGFDLYAFLPLCRYRSKNTVFISRYLASDAVSRFPDGGCSFSLVRARASLDRLHASSCSFTMTLYFPFVRDGSSHISFSPNIGSLHNPLPLCVTWFRFSSRDSGDIFLSSFVLLRSAFAVFLLHSRTTFQSC